MTYSLSTKRIFVAGHRGMVGAAIVRRLASEGCEVLVAGRDELNLLDQAGVRAWMAEHKPDAVILAAAAARRRARSTSSPAFVTVASPPG